MIEIQKGTRYLGKIEQAKTKGKTARKFRFIKYTNIYDFFTVYHLFTMKITFISIELCNNKYDEKTVFQVLKNDLNMIQEHMHS